MKTPKIIHNQQGAVTVEFALIAMLLVLVLFGIIEFGLFLFNRQIIINASREAAREGIVVSLPRLSNNDIEQVARNFCQNNLVSFGAAPLLTVTIPPVGNDPAAIAAGTQRCVLFGCDLNVSVSYNYDFLVLSSFGIGPEQITGVAQMRLE
jgi:Flp pilus assembly protein TadG